MLREYWHLLGSAAVLRVAMDPKLGLRFLNLGFRHLGTFVNPALTDLERN